MQVSGTGVFGVDLRHTIRTEATWRTLLASAVIAIVLLVAYRRPSALFYAGVPLLTGLVTAVLAVSMTFDAVHGITLAFGFTLLGVAIDYPLHYLSHRRRVSRSAALAAIWPTLKLGAISTILAYCALALGGANGMAQLGIFSAAGVLGALLATRWVLPGLMPDGGPGSGPACAASATARPGIAPLSALGIVGMLAAVAAGDQAWWSHDLATLSPVPAERLALDDRLRSAMGARASAIRSPRPMRIFSGCWSAAKR